ncbi:hypothetical protein ACP3TI_11445, partial [Desulforudis sp. 1190]|uniref:hypothetical protein n=1 Tax=Desulforudis sp. 1190 TaxID=3416136 RepID=UPI003CEF5516
VQINSYKPVFQVRLHLLSAISINCQDAKHAKCLKSVLHRTIPGAGKRRAGTRPHVQTAVKQCVVQINSYKPVFQVRLHLLSAISINCQDAKHAKCLKSVLHRTIPGGQG